MYGGIGREIPEVVTGFDEHIRLYKAFPENLLFSIRYPVYAQQQIALVVGKKKAFRSIAKTRSRLAEKRHVWLLL